MTGEITGEEQLAYIGQKKTKQMICELGPGREGGGKHIKRGGGG